MYGQTWVWRKKKWLNATQSQKVLIRLNLWLIIPLQELNQINSRLKIDFWYSIQIDLRVKKASRNLIKINSRLKNFPEYWFRSTHGSKNYLDYWFQSTHDSMIRIINCWLVLLFLGFPLKCWLCATFFFGGGAFDWNASRKHLFESAHDSSIISETWIDSTHDSNGFPGIDSESTHDSSAFTRYWFS